MNAQQKYEQAYAMLRRMYAKNMNVRVIRRAERMVHILSNRMYEAGWSSSKVMVS